MQIPDYVKDMFFPSIEKIKEEEFKKRFDELLQKEPRGTIRAALGQQSQSITEAIEGSHETIEDNGWDVKILTDEEAYIDELNRLQKKPYVEVRYGDLQLKTFEIPLPYYTIQGSIAKSLRDTIILPNSIIKGRGDGYSVKTTTADARVDAGVFDEEWKRSEP